MWRIGHPQWTADTVEFVRAALVVLRLLEERQHRIPVPALAAKLAPVVVIRRIAAHIHHAVDRTGAAEHLAARQIQRAVVQCLLGRAVEHPVDARIGKCLGVADGNVDPRIAVANAGFQQQHPIASGLRKAGRHNAAGRSRAGNDKVVFSSVRHRQISPLPLRGPLPAEGGKGEGAAPIQQPSLEPPSLTRSPLLHAQFVRHPLAHDEFLHLAGHRHRELVNEPDVPRHFVVRDLVAAELSNFLRGQRLAGRAA